MTLSSGMVMDLDYWTRSMVKQIIHKRASGTILWQEDYSYDPAGNLISRISNGVTTSFTVDELGQLLSETHPSYWATYTYDANGNRASKTTTAGTESYSYDAADKLLSVTGAGVNKTYGYDLQGRTVNVTSGGQSTTVGYDLLGRVTGITRGAAASSYTYNGFGARATKTNANGTSTYHRNGLSVVAPVLADGQATYTPGISEDRSGTTKFHQHDRTGSTRIMTNTGQSITDSRHDDAFGLSTGSSGTTPTPFGYKGAWGYTTDPDEGLMLLGHRYYDASTGRFLSRDPIHSGRNWYSYGGGFSNPTMFADPWGLWSFYRWMVTGDGNATDIAYEGGLLGLNDATARWFGHFGQQQKWALPLATLGAVPFVPLRKTPQEMARSGNRGQYTSAPRRAALKLRHTRVGPAAKMVMNTIKRATVSAMGAGRRPLPPGVPVVPTALAWVMWVEAAAATVAGVQTYREDNGALIEDLVDAGGL